jgi:hypothetical protein
MLAPAAHAAENCAAPQTAPSAAVLVLLDRSGSMADPGYCKGSTTESPRKWLCAIQDAKSFIGGNGGVTFADDTVYFVWQFRLLDSDPDPAKITDQYNGTSNNGMCFTNANTLLAPTGSFAGPSEHDANTPLAAAYCQGVKFLQKYISDHSLDIPLYIKVESDGIDNLPTLADVNNCAGVSGGFASFSPHKPVTLTSTTADGLTIGSWEANMYDAAITGTAHAAGASGAFQYLRVGSDFVPVITEFTLVEDTIRTASLQVASPLAVASPLSGLGLNVALGAFSAAAAQTATSPNDDLANYFQGIAQTGGGRVVRFGSGALPVSGAVGSYHVLRGDANDSGCVDLNDFTLVSQMFGQRATAGNANAIRADLNEDGKVNSADYLVLKAQYGKGCATSPGTPPVFANALFGFEDRTSWSSASPISLTGVKHTEGLVSLKVDGTGNREIKSVNFNTAQLKGVTSTLAIDVLRPMTSPNPPSYATVQVFANAPSAGINNAPLTNAKDIRTNTANVFTTVSFAIPANIKAAMTSARSDFSLRIVLNAANAGYEFDNIRFQ